MTCRRDVTFPPLPWVNSTTARGGLATGSANQPCRRTPSVESIHASSIRGSGDQSPSGYARGWKTIAFSMRAAVWAGDVHPAANAPSAVSTRTDARPIPPPEVGIRLLRSLELLWFQVIPGWLDPVNLES